MTRDIKDIITDFREIVKPRIAKMLLKANFEGCGKEDKAEFETEFEMILTLAERGATVEPQGDSIRREAVLNTLENMDKVLDENRTVEAYKDLLRECFKALPPAEPQEWISVKDRLPEKSGEYLATLKYVGKETGTIYISVEETFYEIGKGFQVGRNESVIAWKPLGEPYEAGGEEE